MRFSAPGTLLPAACASPRAAISDATIELTWGDTIRIDPLAPDLAVIGAPYHEVRVDRDGHVEERGYFMGVAQRHAGGWQLRDAHWSVETPPAVVP
jgi:hypothetical protein